VWEMILHYAYTRVSDSMGFYKSLKNKSEPLAQLAEQLTLNQLRLCNSLFSLDLKPSF